VKFEVLEAGEVIFELFNVKGNLVGNQVYPELRPGKYKINMNLNGIDSGIYFYRLNNANTKTEIKNRILLK
jgi:hypothetical protein